MMKEVLEQRTQKEQPTVQSTGLSTKRRSNFTPARFSVRGLRKHPGIQTNRNPRVIG